MIRRSGGRQDQLLNSNGFETAKEYWRASKLAELENAYKAVRENRVPFELTGNPSGESADKHYASEYDYYKLAEIANELDRDDLIAGAAVDRLLRNVLQNGFTYDPKTGNAAADEVLKTRWELYTTSKDEVDHAGEHTFHQLAKLALRAVIVAGDIGSLLTDRGTVQMIESHRIRTPRHLPANERDLCIHGVQLDGDRRHVAYYVTRDDIALNRVPNLTEVVKIDSRDSEGNSQFLHLYHPKRTTQTRGVTKFAPITWTTRMHNDVQFAKLFQQQHVSNYTLVRERSLGFNYPDGYVEPISYEEDPCAPGNFRAVVNSSVGLMYTTLPGEKLSAISGNVPNPTFFDHAKQLQQLIAINMDVPLILLLYDASETNFSGWRGAMEQAKLAFQDFQAWFAGVFHDEVLKWKIRQWSDPRSPFADPFLTRFRLRGVDVFRHGWVFPSWPYVEPLKDATANLVDLANGMTSPRRVQAKSGRDWDVVHREGTDDRFDSIVYGKQRAQEINRLYPPMDQMDRVYWWQLSPLPMPERVNVSVSQSSSEEGDGQTVETA